MEKRSFEKSHRSFDASQSSITSAPVQKSSQRAQDKLPVLNSRRKIKSLKNTSSTYSFVDEDEIIQSESEISQLINDELKRRRNARNQAEANLNELIQKTEKFKMDFEEETKNPTSQYDQAISKQSVHNDTLLSQIGEAKEQLKNLSHSLKTLQNCGKDCNIHMRDLLIDYNCITKGELSKELKRFQRMEIDLKNNLDRLLWRLDCESKLNTNLIDQFHKLQMDFCYLTNLNEHSLSK